MKNYSSHDVTIHFYFRTNDIEEKAGTVCVVVPQDDSICQSERLLLYTVARNE